MSIVILEIMVALQFPLVVRIYIFVLLEGTFRNYIHDSFRTCGGSEAVGFVIRVIGHFNAVERIAMHIFCGRDGDGHIIFVSVFVAINRKGFTRLIIGMHICIKRCQRAV